MHLLPPLEEIQQQVLLALQEDIGSGDITSQLLPKEMLVQAKIISREPMLLCGQAWVDMAFRMDCPEIQIAWQEKEGAWLAQPTRLCEIIASVGHLLERERTALNFLQTLSGTATKTHQYVQLIKHTNTEILDTRKTIPGLRSAQKYAVRCGGGKNHRMGLYDAFLIKENHIKACGSISKAIEKARSLAPDLFLEVEVETLQELEEALKAKPARILLDNFSNAMLEEAVGLNQAFGCELEASGGIDANTITSIAEKGLDYISLGDITKSVHAIDLSLLLVEVGL